MGTFKRVTKSIETMSAEQNQQYFTFIYWLQKPNNQNWFSNASRSFVAKQHFVLLKSKMFFFHL